MVPNAHAAARAGPKGLIAYRRGVELEPKFASDIWNVLRGKKMGIILARRSLTLRRPWWCVVSQIGSGHSTRIENEWLPLNPPNGRMVVGWLVDEDR